jgi:hypothetical protein
MICIVMSSLCGPMFKLKGIVEITWLIFTYNYVSTYCIDGLLRLHMVN